MCGLFGCKTNQSFNSQLTNTQKTQKKRVIEALALAMQSRGKDSTGIAFVDDGKFNLVKDIHAANLFIDFKKVQKRLEENSPLIIGHTRWASVGEVSKENAHPFRKGQIIGAHNGGVSNYLQIDKEVSVDSEVIFKLLKDSNNDFRESFKKLSGNFAITWSYLDEKNVFYCVKDGNPLYMAYVPSIKTIFWCSEERPLESVLTSAFGRKSFDWRELEDEMVYKFDDKLKRRQYKVSFKEDTYVGNYGSNYYYDDGYKLSTYSSEIDDDEVEAYKTAYGKKNWRTNRELMLAGEKEEEEDEEDDALIEYDKDGDLVMTREAVHEMRRRLFEDGCSMCGTAPTDDYVYYDMENDCLYCENCVKELKDDFPEYAQLEKVKIF